MEIIIYITAFIIGTVFGSFFTLAVYRLPLKQDITHKRSYCPNCNHRLEFLDLIPILSYIFLGGKCRYCKQKIRPRYLVLEVLSGITFLLFTISFKLNIFNLNINTFVELSFGLLYIATLFLIAGIDKENHKIQKSVMIFGLVIELIYIIYLYIFIFDIYKYVIYLFIMLIIEVIDCIILRKKGSNSYSLNILFLCFYMAVAFNEGITIITIIATLFAIAIKEMLTGIKDKKKAILKNEAKEKTAIAFFMCTVNIVVIIINNFLIHYII